MTDPSEYQVTATEDRPRGGMWHCGPNPVWVTVTHLPTMTSARAYHRSGHKAKEMAMACVEMMVEQSGERNCGYPAALAEGGGE